MNDVDETIQYRPPSRSEQRRHALDVLALAARLAELAPGRLQRMPLSAELRAHVEQTRRITSHIARKRQLGFLAKQLRREEADALAAIGDALDSTGQAARQDNARLNRIEHWRERLLAEGDGALAELLATHPGTDPQPLRQLLRRAREERAANKPPRAFRELFAQLRRIVD